MNREFAAEAVLNGPLVFPKAIDAKKFESLEYRNVRIGGKRLCRTCQGMMWTGNFENFDGDSVCVFLCARASIDESHLT